MEGSSNYEQLSQETHEIATKNPYLQLKINKEIQADPEAISYTARVMDGLAAVRGLASQYIIAGEAVEIPEEERHHRQEKIAGDVAAIRTIIETIPQVKSEETEILDATIDRVLQDPDVTFPSGKSKQIVIDELEALDIAPNKASIIRHDLGNVLTVLSGFIQLKKGYDTPVIQTMLRRLVDTPGQNETPMDLMLHHLRDAFPEQDITWVDFEKALSEGFIFGLQQENVTVIVDHPEINGVSLSWSQEWMAALLDNVKSNTKKSFTAKHTPEGGLSEERQQQADELHISWRIDRDGNNVLIRFDDNGTGVRQQDIQESGRFEKGRTGWSGGVEGTGIGMATHARAIEKYHGTLSIRNRVSETGEVLGASLEISLPTQKFMEHLKSLEG